MKKIYHFNTYKNFEEKTHREEIENKRKENKTPEAINNKRKDIKDSFNQILQNSAASFEQSNNFKKRFKNKEEYDNFMFYEKYLISKSEYNKIINDLSDIDIKINNNSELIEKLNKNINKLKKRKKKKQSEIINLLSNKESLEEIYKSKMYCLVKNSQILGLQFINDNKDNKENNNNQKELDKNQKNNNNNNYDCNPCSSIMLFKENNFEVSIDEIKLSDKKKYEEQVILFTEDILQKKDDDITNKLKEKINKSYKIFFSEIDSIPNLDTNKIISNFFIRISLFISNQSMGKFSESFINSFLKHLIKINCVGVEISEIITFLNISYKETKNEMKENINNLIKKNENLKNKKISYEKKMNELKEFIDENKEFFINIDKNKITIDNENNNNYFISFISDNNNNFFSKRKRSIKEEINKRKNSCRTTRIDEEKINNLKKYKTSKLNDEIFNNNNNIKLNGNTTFNSPNQNEQTKKRKIFQIKDVNFKIRHIKNNSVNSNKDLGYIKNDNINDENNDYENKNIKKGINIIQTKKINMNEILNVNNYQINNTWNNDFNNYNNTKEYINISSITKVDNKQLIGNINNYIMDLNKIPINKNNDNNNNRNRIKLQKNRINKNAINVNNLLINNNINIENNNNIINNTNEEFKTNKENKSNPKIRVNNTNIIYNKRIKDNFNNKKNTSFNYKKVSIKKTNIINKTPSKNDIYKNNIRTKTIDNNKDNFNNTEIKYNNNENNLKNRIIKIKINKENNKTNYNFPDIKNNKKIKVNRIFNDSKSQKDINEQKNLNIINSPKQKYNNNQIYYIKENVKNETLKTENTQKNKKFHSIFKISKSPNINKVIVSKYNNKFYMSPQNKIAMTSKYNENNNDINKNEDNLNKKIEALNISKNNSYTKRFDNRLKLLTQGINESFCYFKLSDKTNIKFDPLDNCCTTTPEICGYIEGHILIDIILHNFKIIPKIIKDKNILLDKLLTKNEGKKISEINYNEDEEEEEEDEKINNKNKNYIGINLQDITDVQLSNQMKNIIRIYNSYIKNGRGQENFNINKFVYNREINDIPMDQDNKIKAAFCNFFMFTLFLDKKLIPKIDFIFTNYDEFNLWHNCFQYVAKNNSQSKKILYPKTDLYNENQ